MVDGTLCAPTKEGWGDGCYVVVLSSTKAASDPNGAASSEGDTSYPVSNAPSVGKFSRKNGLTDTKGEGTQLQYLSTYIESVQHTWHCSNFKPSYMPCFHLGVNKPLPVQDVLLSVLLGQFL